MNETQKSDRMTKRLAAPVSLSLALALLYFSLKALGPSWMDLNDYTYLIAALVACAGEMLVRTANFVLFDVLFRRRKGREASQLLRMVTSTIGYLLLFIVIYTVVFKKSLSGVMATSAVLTVILGLALQDTLGNFFAGISLHIEEPYQIGDAMRIGEVVGRVESVTWRTTTMRTSNNSLVVFPNSRVARDPIEIFPLNSQNRRVLHFPAAYSHRPERMIRLIREAVASVPRVSAENAPVVRIADFMDSSISYEVLYWLSDYMWASEVDAAIRERIWYVFLRNGLEIPFPTRHVLLEQREETKPQEQPDYGEFLSSVGILKPLSRRELTEVVRSLERHIYAPREFLLRKGDRGNSMFVIHRGRVEVLIDDADGQEQQVAILGRGEVLGEMGLFTGEPRSATVRALEELEVLEVRKPVMENLLAGNDGLAWAFSLTIADRQALLMERSRHTAGEELQIQSESILQRIKNFFSLA